MLEPANPPESALAAFRAVASALEVEDILALCFAFSRDPRRLKVYLDVLRGKPGIKAQAAACLICFDLARQGDKRFETEFMALLPVVTEWARPDRSGGASLADRLIGDQTYLRRLWTDLQGRLGAVDPRADPSLAVEDIAAVEIDLFDEADFAEIGVDDLDVLRVDTRELHRRWQQALDRFCFWNPDPMTARADAPPGFFADNRADLRRLDAFRQDALSLASDVRPAADMVAVLDLFLAAHTRARTLFGTRNRQRDEHLERGLLQFFRLDGPPLEAVAWLMDPTAAPHSWEKVAEILLDFTSFLGRQPRRVRTGDPAAVVKNYLGSARQQPPPSILVADARERRRRRHRAAASL